MLERDLAEAHDLHPHYNAKSILALYSRLIDKLSPGSEFRLDTSKPTIFKQHEKSFLNGLHMSLIDSREDENLKSVLVFLQEQGKGLAIDKQDNPEFELFKFVFQSGLRPVLESEAFVSEYKTTKKTFNDLARTLISSFEHGDRVMFTFHAGELFKAREFYINGKNLGLSNAITLSVRNFIRHI